MRRRVGNRIYAQTDDPREAMKMRALLNEVSNTDDFTVTAGITRVYAVRRWEIDWHPDYLRWRAAFYREFGVRT